MVDVAFQPNNAVRSGSVKKRASLRTAMKRKSTAAFLMTLPLLLLIAILVIYPAFYSLHLATLNKTMQRFVGFGNFEFLFKRETFWLVVKQSCIFAITAVGFKALIGFIVAHFGPKIPATAQPTLPGPRAVSGAAVCLSSPLPPFPATRRWPAAAAPTRACGATAVPVCRSSE